MGPAFAEMKGSLAALGLAVQLLCMLIDAGGDMPVAGKE